MLACLTSASEFLNTSRVAERSMMQYMSTIRVCDATRVHRRRQGSFWLPGVGGGVHIGCRLLLAPDRRVVWRALFCTMVCNVLEES